MSGLHHGLHHSREILCPIKIAITLNYVLAIAEFVIYFFSGHSVAILAAALENTVHGTVWLLSHQFTLQSLKPPDEKYTYGRGGYGAVIPLVNALFLLVVGIWILAEGKQRIQTPQEVAGQLITTIAIIDILSNFVQIKVMWKYHDHKTILSGTGHIMTDTFAGLAVVCSGLAAWQFGKYGIDGYAAILIAIFSVTWAVFFICPVIPSLLRKAPIPTAQLQTFITARFPVITDVHEIHPQLFADSVILELHVVVPNPDIDLDTLKQCLRQALHEEKRFHIEHCTIEAERRACNQQCALAMV